MMNKYLKYGWLAIIVIIPVFLNFSKTEQDIFTVMTSSNLEAVQAQIDKKPRLLNTKDKNGFTMYDYAVLNNDADVKLWVQSQKISSGVSQSMIERVRLWFLLLGIPVPSENFNLQGIYDRGLEEAILSYQTTRGLPKQPQITPDWYAHLEEDGIRFLQELLFEADSDMVTGFWNDESTVALKSFQKSEGLPETGHLSLADIVALKRTYANTIAENSVIPAAIGIIVDDGSNNPVDAPIIDEATNVEEVKVLPEVEAQKEAAPDLEESSVVDEIQQTTEATDSEALPVEESSSEQSMTAGFLIDSNASAGKLLNLQVWLTLAGFPAGTLDGQMGPSTRQAIKDFESSIGLKPTGIMSAKWETPLEKIVWKKVQEKLKQLELYDQVIDGIPGKSTVDALKAYEESIGLNQNGTLLPETLSMLFNEGQMINDGSMDDVVAENIDNTEEDGIIEEEGGDEGIITETEVHDDSDLTSDASNTLAGFNPEDVGDTVMLQLMLATLGNFTGEVNGKNSPELTEAIKAFQSSNKLSADGKAGRQTMAEMNKQVIVKIQQYLNAKNLLEDKPTGTLGPKTRKILIDLRKQHKLPEVDPTQLDIGTLLIVLGDANKENYVKTYLDVLEQQRIQKEKVQKTQEYLTALGYFNGKIDGLQGKSTNDAVLKFKKDNKMAANEELTDALFKEFEKETVKKIQSELAKLGYKLKADGMMGPTTKKTIETFQKRYSHKVTGDATLETLLQVNARVAANSRRAPATATNTNTASSVANDQVVRGVMPKMGAKGAQSDTILTSPPQAIAGRMTMIHNSKGVLSGCKVNNISISAAMCGSARNNQQCRIVYRKGRVLSVSCKG